MSRNLNISKKWFLIGLAVFIVIVGLFVYQTLKPSQVVSQPTPKATIDKLPSQPAVNNGEKELAKPGSKNQGTSTDNNGVSSGSEANASGQWTKSESGLITVKQPGPNSTIKNGAEVSGSASVSKVQYRLTDDQVGVISQGFINVVDGKFSASISFSSRANSGRLDVFSSNQAGAEINEVQIPVKF